MRFLLFEYEHRPVDEVTLLPRLVNRLQPVLVVDAVSVFRPMGVGAFVRQLPALVVFLQAAFQRASFVVRLQVGFRACPFPPASLFLAVLPVQHFGGVAAVGEDHLLSLLYAHLVAGFLYQLAVFGIELPLSVAVLQAVFALRHQAPFLVVGFMLAAFPVVADEGVAQPHRPVGVEVFEHSRLASVLEVAFKDFVSLLVGLYPVSLLASLFVYGVLCGAHKA